MSTSVWKKKKKKERKGGVYISALNRTKVIGGETVTCGLDQLTLPPPLSTRSSTNNKKKKSQFCRFLTSVSKVIGRPGDEEVEEEGAAGFGGQGAVWRTSAVPRQSCMVPFYRRCLFWLKVFFFSSLSVK